jgi:hypothetical protein
VIRLDARGEHHQPPPPRYTTPLLEQAIRGTVAVVRYDTAAITGHDPLLGRVLRFGPQTDVRTIHDATGLPATGTALPARAVANYIAKYATKTTTAPGLPSRPVRSATDITGLACSQHHRQLVGTAWTLGKHPAAAALARNRWTHTLGYRGHFLTKSRRYSVIFTALRRARIDYRRAQRHPGGELDAWRRVFDERIVLTVCARGYAGTGSSPLAAVCLSSPGAWSAPSGGSATITRSA